MPPTASIETALVDAILAQRNARTPTLRETFWASSLGHCPLKQVAERAGLLPTNPPDSRARIKMWMGTVYGAALQQALRESQFLHPDWMERRVTYRSYSGRVDGYTPHVQEGAIVEIKTCDDDAITRYPEMPEHYKMQGLFYCVATGVPNLLLFQVGKSQGLVRHRVYRCSEQDKELIDIYIGVAERAWEVYQKTGTLPEHLHSFKWEDRLCPMLDLEAQVAGKEA